MTVKIEIPDQIAARLGGGGQDLSRRMLEVLLIGEVRAGRMNEPELAELLGIARIELDRVLKGHGVSYEITIDDIDQDLVDLKRLGV